MNSKYLLILFFIFFGIKLIIGFDYARKLFCQQPEIKAGTFTAFTGDSFSYTGAMENYITSGEYFFEAGNKKIYAGRVPHYSVPYYILRQIFNKTVSLDLFIILQLMLEATAFFLVSLLIFEITGSKLSFYLSLLFSVVSFFYLHYTLIPITDSPAASFLLISFWFLFRYVNAATPKFIYWVLFSLILAIATILRPYFGLAFIFVGLVLLIKYKTSLVSLIKHCIVYGMALLVLLAPWIVRNYSQFGKIMLFQQDKYAGYDIGKELLLTRKMLAAIGEDASTMWDKQTAAGFFSRDYHKISVWKVPAEISADTILNRNFFAINDLCLDSIDDRSQRAAFNLHYQAFIDQYKAKHKFRYYFLNYFSRIKKFLIHSGSYYYSYTKEETCDKRINFYVKVMQSLCYFLCLIPGFAGLLLLARNKKYGLFFLLPTLTLILFFPIILGIVEWRYFLPFYFFHQIGLFYLFQKLLEFFKLRI